jgi:hypothetical protein
MFYNISILGWIAISILIAGSIAFGILHFLSKESPSCKNDTTNKQDGCDNKEQIT